MQLFNQIHNIFYSKIIRKKKMEPFFWGAHIFFKLCLRQRH